MLNVNEKDIKGLIAQKVADEIISQDNDLSELISKEVKARLDAIFADRAEKQIQAEIDAAIKDGFEREYCRVNQWGHKEGSSTSISKELSRIVTSYWSEKVNPKSGNPTNDSYSGVTRAQFVMTQICAQDFSESMKQSLLNVTGALKDGLRAQLAEHMDQMLNGLFRVKSLQDQGKVEKPW